jgi:hypothetical protein
MKLFLETKKRIADAVEVYYDFDASRSNGFNVSRKNANLASKLLRDRSLSTVVVLLRFLHYSLTITQEPNPDGVFHHPYRHPAIQKAINITWFRIVIDVGFDLKKHFSPLPVPAIAYILAAVRAVFDFDSHMFSRAG